MDIFTKNYTNRHDDRASPREEASQQMAMLAKSYTNKNNDMASQHSYSLVLFDILHPSCSNLVNN